MKVRMLPAATVFSRFPRVVRDLSRSTGKEIRLEVSGAETEIDKKVIDRMSEPLVHLVRNAADHGIERGEERRAAGKDPSGLIRLSAYQEGDRICVEVSDDGRGLDRPKIIAKAVERGLIAREAAQDLSEEAVSALVFLPGFSTAETVSDISGRGVGLDVVKEFVEEMNGALRVRSAPGQGTTVTITLPLTMAIIRAILVESAGLLYAIPISAVSEVVRPTAASYTTIHGHQAIKLRDEILAVVPLPDLLANASADDLDPAAARHDAPGGDGQHVIVVRQARHRVGIGVAKVLGNTEVVVKSLGRHYREVEGLLGASILGNGRMAIILDVGVLLDLHFAVGGGQGQAVSSAGPRRERVL
jgi:two-component system chemotaxis sensor kinase CheA